MKPWTWLRIAAVLQALGTVGHNLATLSTKPTHGPQEQAVFDAMRRFQFNMMGSTRSTRDFYRKRWQLQGGRWREIDPEKRLVMSWKAHWVDSVAKDRPSRVTYELSAGGPSISRLHLVHDDFDGQTATYSDTQGCQAP